MHLTRQRTPLVLLTMLLGLFTPLAAQKGPTLLLASTNRDSILKALTIEMRTDGLSYAKYDRNRALFTMDTGIHRARGEMVDVTLEATVLFTTVPGGTRLEVTETLSAALSTGSERRTSDPRRNWDGYMAILYRTKARLEQADAPASQDSSGQ